MKIVGVIGAGQMGSGIAQTAAQFGYQVLLTDVSQEIADKGKAGIGKALDRLVSRDKMDAADAKTILQRITPIGEYGPMAEAAIIIEAATEREEIKHKIFENAAAVLAADAILASNTSSIPITRMAARTPDPSRFIGLHFFNPVPVMGLIEVIPGLPTSQATTDKARAFCESLGKEVVLAGDEPGFVVNRILVPMLNEAVRTLEETGCAPEDIDRAMRFGAGWPMGPLALLDLIGADVQLHASEALWEDLRREHVAAPVAVRRLVEAGDLGRKSGRGIYRYGD